MSFLKEKYNQLCEVFIRPKRQRYSEEDLGEKVFVADGVRIVRQDFRIANKKQLEIVGSVYRPENAQRKKCILYLHSNAGSQLEIRPLLDDFSRMGANFASFDFSGSGNSQGDIVTLGFDECKDVDSVIKYLIEEHDFREFLIWGRSMGAVAAIYYMKNIKESKFKRNITGLVLDSPFSDLEALAMKFCSERYAAAPNFLFKIGLSLLNMGINRKSGLDLKTMKPIEVISAIDVPCLFIYANQDEIVPYEQINQLFKAVKGHKMMVFMGKGSHGSERGPGLHLEILPYIKSLLIHRKIPIQMIEKKIFLLQAENKIKQDQKLKINRVAKTVKNNSNKYFQSQNPQKTKQHLKKASLGLKSRFKAKAQHQQNQLNQSYCCREENQFMKKRNSVCVQNTGNRAIQVKNRIKDMLKREKSRVEALNSEKKQAQFTYQKVKQTSIFPMTKIRQKSLYVPSILEENRIPKYQKYQQIIQSDVQLPRSSFHSTTASQNVKKDIMNTQFYLDNTDKFLDYYSRKYNIEFNR